MADNLQAYYTEAPEIRDLMVYLLGDTTNKDVLEPAAGDGAFIDALIGTPKSIDVVDVNEAALKVIKKNHGELINAVCTDFIDLFVGDPLLRSSLLKPTYDLIISNPPYGLKIPLEYRQKIKRTYPKIYARESYSLFLEFSLMTLKAGGRYVFIIPDTFLHSTYHKPLRHSLITYGAPTHIIQFRSSRFQSVNFGYGGFCILVGNRGELSKPSKIKWLDYRKSNEALTPNVVENAFAISGEQLIDSFEGGWFQQKSQGENLSLNLALFRSLGDIAECKTGIYTGNNTDYCGYDENLKSPRGMGHPINWRDSVFLGNLTDDQKEFGLTSKPTYVPLIRGGHREPFSETEWAVNWSKDALHFYKTDKKARLQNSTFYFKEGLAMPMVTTGRFSASLIKNAVFDQGVVGVFPHDNRLLDFLLIYLNSSFVSQVLRKSISGSTNNSANYVKKILVPVLNDGQINKSHELIEMARHHGWKGAKLELDAFIVEIIEATKLDRI
jgi:adenine-specific DNA-methyltransferase